MSNPSNLYAEKIFSEHPISLWSLDDTANYISLISEGSRDLSEWTVTGGTAEPVLEILDEPFPNSHTTRLIADEPTGTDSFVSCVSPDLISITDLNPTLATFSVGAFLYSNTAYVSGFDIGYEYFDSISGELVTNTKFFSSEVHGSWIFVSETFQPLVQNSSIRLVIQPRFYSGDVAENYTFLVNGISLGQWSEEFNATSLGVTKQQIPTNIFGSSETVYGVRAEAYGLSDNPGYYLINDNALVAKNSGIPMTFGTPNATSLYPNPGKPSLIIPGGGFLNKSGQNNEYTVEFWMRISSDTTEEKRIFGNLRGTDGLYVNGPILSLKVGQTVIRHYVGQWVRPMLIQIKYSNSSVGLMINGEEIGESFSSSDLIDFPESEVVINSNTLNADWLGFWTYDDLYPVEVEGVAIYGYRVPIQVAKRRFIYGQGVEFPENINASYSGSSVFIDYPFAKYSKNYSYPSIGRWSQGSYDNVSSENNTLSFLKHDLPKAFFDNKTESEWMDQLELAQNEDNSFISLRPNSSWNNTNGYVLFENFSLGSEAPKAIYVTCKEKSVVDDKQSIIILEDKSTGNYFEISIKRNSIDYSVYEQGVEHLIVSKAKYFSGEEYIISVDFQKFSDFYGGMAAKFFGKMSTLSVYIGGDKSFSNTFQGNIYHIGICSNKNLNKIASSFASDGVAFADEFIDGSVGPLGYDAGTDVQNSAVFAFLLDGGTFGEYANTEISKHIASYNVCVGNSLSGFKLLVGAESSWEDYVPLSFFAKNVQDSKGNDRLDLDFIQFNINYPAPSKFVQEQINTSWRYDELQSQYANPVQRSYDILDNQLFTGFENYNDLKNKAQNLYKYDTSNLPVRTYITFQLLEDGANNSTDYFTNTEPAPKTGIVVPGDNWLTTKYEVVNNMIIYPPSSVAFDKVAMVTHIELRSASIYDMPIGIRSLEYASLSLSDTAPTPIGTRFGNDMYPYRKDGFYFTYKDKNPFTIYKGSTPYLYLTRDSGITLKGQYDPLINRGISIPINSPRSDNYKVIALQASIRFDQDFFPYAPVQIFELQSKNSYIRFYMQATHPGGQRAKIYAINSRGQLENGIAFYLNGNIVKNPTITIKEWSMLGIRFANTQDFNNFEGALRITGPLTFNNISYYKSTNLQEVQTVVERPWFRVKSTGPLSLDWSYWNAIPYMWKEVLVISTTSYYGVDPSDIYNIYTGTNKIIIDDEVQTSFGDYAYKIYKDVSWKSQVYQAV